MPRILVLQVQIDRQMLLLKGGEPELSSVLIVIKPSLYVKCNVPAV